MIITLKENRTLQEMLLGILTSGVVAAVLFLIFSDNPAYNIIGTTIGMAGAAFMAIHMAVTIEDAVLLNEKGAAAYVRKMTYIRYMVACVLVVIVGITDVGSPVMTVVGFLFLKVGAYMQPLFHKILNRKEENVFTEAENTVIMDEMQSNLSSYSDEDFANNKEITQGGE